MLNVTSKPFSIRLLLRSFGSRLASMEAHCCFIVYSYLF